MKRLKLLLISFTIAAAASSEASVLIRGAAKCGSWVSDRNVGGALTAANEFWLLGYLSGLAVGARLDFMRTADPKSLELWMDNYCRNNPLDSIATGADALATELVKRMRD